MKVIAKMGGDARAAKLPEEARIASATRAALTRWGQRKTDSPNVNDLLTEGVPLGCKWCGWTTRLGIVGRESGWRRLWGHHREVHPARFAALRAQQRREA
jgi:hypothetical protein